MQFIAQDEVRTTENSSRGVLRTLSTEWNVNVNEQN